MNRFSLVKTFLALIYLVVLFLIQGFLIREWTAGVLIQAIILNTAIILGIYAFRGFETRTALSLNSSFIATAVGGLSGAVIALIPILFFIERRIGRLAYIWTLILVVFAFPLITFVVMRLAVRRTPPQRFLVVGKSESISHIMEDIVKKSLNKIEIVGYVSDERGISDVLNNGGAAFDALLVVDQELMRPVRHEAEKAHTKGVTIQFLPELVEENLSRIPIEAIQRFSDYYSVLFSHSRYSQLLRLLDVLLASLASIVLSPAIVFSIIYILTRDGRPVFYSQTRHGLNGAEFSLYKFRSMTQKTSLSEEDPELIITKSGRLLRTLRFNELPQFFNVIKGDMSIVGPRPDIRSTYEFCTSELPYYHYRTKIMPGLTGHAQVQFLHLDELDRDAFGERLSYDLYYVKNYTITLYLSTILKTLETMVFGKGRAG